MIINEKLAARNAGVEWSGIRVMFALADEDEDEQLLEFRPNSLDIS